MAFRKNLGDILGGEGTPKVLVYGHGGCGKSSEINKFLSELPTYWLPVVFKAGDYLPTSGNQAADVLLAACTRLMEVVKEKDLRLNEDSLEPVLEYFAETTDTVIKTREKSVDGEVGVDTGGSVWHQPR